MSIEEGAMIEGDALVYAYLLDGKGGGAAVDWNAIDDWNPSQGLFWIHLDSKIDKTRVWLESKSGLSQITWESLLDPGTRPRNIVSDEGLLLILRGVNCNPGEDPEDMVAIRMLFSEHRIITTRYRRVMAIQDVNKAINAKKGPCTAGDFLVMVAERIADRMGDIVADLDDSVDELEDTVVTSEIHELRSKLADLRRKAISLRRYIAPQRDVLFRLIQERISFLNEVDRAHLREVAERTARFVEDVDSAKDRASITQEELNNKLSEQMNRAMYTLSIVAAIFLPLGLLTGLLGINVGGIPGAENRWAFALVVVVLAAMAVGLLVWFKRIKWL
jgi:zinc transporter